ncbi:MAG: hypothetical protein AB7O65_03225 [Candidatus Korobacteraceae bacterium]
MCSSVKSAVRSAIACALVAVFMMPSGLLAQTHVVTSADLHKELVDATQARRQNIEKLEGLLSSPNAGTGLSKAHVDLQQVKTAIASLSDAELAQLASQTDQAQRDFAAGQLTERDLLLIILGVAVLVLIIVAVR